MKIDYFDPRTAGRRIHKRETHILSAAAAILAFIIVYAYTEEPKLYYAIAAAALMGSAIYFANYLQFHRNGKNHSS